jgi:glucose-6-phosphate isomerase
LTARRDAMYAGEKINTTENHAAVLHTALRVMLG